MHIYICMYKHTCICLSCDVHANIRLMQSECTYTNVFLYIPSVANLWDCTHDPPRITLLTDTARPKPSQPHTIDSNSIALHIFFFAPTQCIVFAPFLVTFVQLLKIVFWSPSTNMHKCRIIYISDFSHNLELFVLPHHLIYFPAFYIAGEFRQKLVGRLEVNQSNNGTMDNIWVNAGRFHKFRIQCVQIHLRCGGDVAAAICWLWLAPHSGHHLQASSSSWESGPVRPLPLRSFLAPYFEPGVCVPVCVFVCACVR